VEKIGEHCSQEMLNSVTYLPDAIRQRDAKFQFSMTFNFTIFYVFQIFGTRLLRYLKKTENRYRKKNTDNTDISIFFRDCNLFNFMLNFTQIFLLKDV
jgi:hypothetical protein